MLRIKSDKLVYLEGLVYFKDVPFTGTSFTLDGCNVTQKKMYQNGIYVGEYVNEIITQRYENYPEVEFDCLDYDSDWTNPPIYYKDKLFTGLSYDFEDEYCTEEMFYVNGIFDADIALVWNKYGELQEIEVDDKDQIYQKLYRYNNQDMSIHEMEIILFENNVQKRFEMRIDENNDLAMLSIFDGYFDTIPSIREKIYFEPVENKTYFKEIRIGNGLALFDAGVDDDIFNYLCEENKILNLKSLFIKKTSISIASIEKVLKLGRLEKLNITDNNYDNVALNNLKQQYPQTEIIFNGEVL